MFVVELGTWEVELLFGGGWVVQVVMRRERRRQRGGRRRGAVAGRRVGRRVRPARTRRPAL